jgi:hypothetical protein
MTRQSDTGLAITDEHKRTNHEIERKVVSGELVLRGDTWPDDSSTTQAA